MAMDWCFKPRDPHRLQYRGHTTQGVKTIKKNVQIDSLLINDSVSNMQRQICIYIYITMFLLLSLDKKTRSSVGRKKTLSRPKLPEVSCPLLPWLEVSMMLTRFFFPCLNLHKTWNNAPNYRSISRHLSPLQAASILSTSTYSNRIQFPCQIPSDPNRIQI